MRIKAENIRTRCHGAECIMWNGMLCISKWTRYIRYNKIRSGNCVVALAGDYGRCETWMSEAGSSKNTDDEFKGYVDAASGSALSRPWIFFCMDSKTMSPFNGQPIQHYSGIPISSQHRRQSKVAIYNFDPKHAWNKVANFSVHVSLVSQPFRPITHWSAQSKLRAAFKVYVKSFPFMPCHFSQRIIQVVLFFLLIWFIFSKRRATNSKKALNKRQIPIFSPHSHSCDLCKYGKYIVHRLSCKKSNKQIN